MTPTRPYAVSAVANYILQHSHGSVTNLKLQKMLYYMQGFFLGKFGTPLFDEDLVAWKYGPVIPGLYSALSHNRDNPITETLSAPYSIEDAEDRQFLDSAIATLEPYDAIYLLRKSHMPGSPWSTIWQNGAGYRHVIPKELIRSYFVASMSRTVDK